METYRERDDWENSLSLSLRPGERKYEPMHVHWCLHLPIEKKKLILELKERTTYTIYV